MDEILFKKVIIELIPKEHHANAFSFIDAVYKAPHSQAQAAVGRMLLLFTSLDKNESISAINGFLTGLAFFYSWNKDPATIERGAKDFLEFRNREKGNNIVSLIDKRIEKI